MDWITTTASTGRSTLYAYADALTPGMTMGVKILGYSVDGLPITLASIALNWQEDGAMKAIVRGGGSFMSGMATGFIIGAESGAVAGLIGAVPAAIAGAIIGGAVSLGVDLFLKNVIPSHIEDTLYKLNHTKYNIDNNGNVNIDTQFTNPEDLNILAQPLVLKTGIFFF